MKQWNKLGLMNKQNELSCVFLEKAQTAGTDQNLLFVAVIFLVAILFFPYGVLVICSTCRVMV